MTSDLQSSSRPQSPCSARSRRCRSAPAWVVAERTCPADPFCRRGTTARPRTAIISFVAAVTTQGAPDFVPADERIAVFDNDGTLWVEQPMYVQLAFALDRVKALAPQNPEWKTTQPFKAVLDGDMKALAAAGEKGLDGADGGDACRHDRRTNSRRSLPTGSRPRATRRFKRPYTELVYQPMLELLAYLRANGFKTFIVSGGGIEFMRPWAERVYGIPPEQVVGSSIKTKFEMRDGDADAVPAAGDQFHRRQGRQAGRHQSSISAAGRSPRSAIPTATSKCCNGRR